MDLQTCCSNCFASLSCSQRIRIINLLKKNKSLNVGSIVKSLDLSQPTITHHLNYLKKTGIVKRIKVGSKVYYSVDPKCGFTKCKLFS